jgi:hypothetical protein
MAEHDPNDDDLLMALGGLMSDQEAEAERAQAAIDEGDAEALGPEGPRLVEALRPLDETELAHLQTAVRAKKPTAKVLRFPARRWAWVAAGLAAAAALVFLLRPAPPTPAYELVVRSAGAQDVRGEVPEGSLTFRPGTRFDFVLRPSEAVTGVPRVQAFRTREGERQTWDAPVERDPKGAIRVTGTVGDGLPFEPGEWTLEFMVGEPPQTLSVVVTLTP